MKILLLIISLAFPVLLHAQDKKFAKKIIDTLTSEAFHGRGYVEDGDRKAAEYIAGIYDILGLEMFGNSYFQELSIDVNTFPKVVKVVVDRNKLVPGKDYLIEPGSPDVRGSFKLKYITEKELENPNELMRSILGNSEKTFMVFPPYDLNNKGIVDLINFLKYDPSSPIGGIIQLTEDKLTWSGSTYQFQRPVITIRSEIFPSNAEKFAVNIKAKFEEQYKTRNVIGKIPGKSDSIILITAHYDHLGRMGKDVYFPGANDNASGTAFLLDLARHYGTKDSLPDYTMVFIAFTAEEIGLLGSKYFVENPLFPLKQIRFLLNFDLAGTGDDGIQVVNGSVFKDQFNLLQEINNQQNLLPEVKIRGKACNSDHCFFTEKGVPGFFIYTLGGITAYHDINDVAETLPLTEYEDYFRLITQFLERLD